MSAAGDYYGGQEQSLVHIERTGDVTTITLRGMTNHEIRDIIVGLWARLDEDDRLDHIRALTHYATDPRAVLPHVSRAIKDAAHQKPFVV